MNAATVLECSNCLEPSPEPLYLPCCHTVCKQCLEKDAKPFINPNKVCPICKKEVSTSGEYDDVYHSLNACLKTMSEVLSTKPFKRDTTNCCICRMKNIVSKATHQCLDCGDALCEECRGGHQSSSATHAHQVVDIDDIREGKVNVKAPKSFPCSDKEHKDRKCAFYCDTCNSPLCDLCLVFKHLGHQVISLPEAAEKCKSKLQELTQKMEEKLDGPMKLSGDSLARHRKNIDKTQATTVSAVREKTQALIDMILTQERAIVQKITKACDRQRTDLDVKLENQRQVLKMGDMSVSLSKSVLKGCADEEIIILFGGISKILDTRFISKSEADVSRFASKLTSPVYTVQYNFPEPQSAMFNLKESFLEPTETAPVVAKASPGVVSSHSEKKSVLRPTDPDTIPKHKPAVYQSGLLPTSGIKKVDSSVNKTPESTLKKADGSVTLDAKQLPVRSNTIDRNPNADGNGESAFKVTESLSIVGDFGRSLSLTENSSLSSEGHSEERSFEDGFRKTIVDSSSNDGLPDVIPGPLDCKLHPPEDLSRTSVRENLEGAGAKSKTLSDLSFLKKSLTKSKSLCLVEKKTISTRVAKDKEDPIYVGMCRNSDNRFVVLDDGNKKVKILHESGKQDGVNHPNTLTESLSHHGVAKCGNIMVYVGDKAVHITDGVLNMKQTFKLDLPENIDQTEALPLCQYSETSFLLGNLPGNKYRVYSVSGDLIEEGQSPVEGPIAAISSNKDGHLLYSSWSQPGAVYKISNNNEKVKTYRPPGTDTWYPEGTCVDMGNNVYVASPRQNQIHVFRSNGSVLYVHSDADLSSPRCLTMLSNNTLIVSGDGPDLHSYKCTYCMKT